MFLTIAVLIIADDKHKLNTIVTQNEDAANDQLDAWTAHKTEAGIVYYYNALTGKSTYDKPPGFKAEVLILTIFVLSRSHTFSVLIARHL
jgi:hypothetical protein